MYIEIITYSSGLIFVTTELVCRDYIRVSLTKHNTNNMIDTKLQDKFTDYILRYLKAFVT